MDLDVMDKNLPWNYLLCLNKINNCGEPDKFQERLSSHRATAPQPIIDMSRGTLGEGVLMIKKWFEGRLLYFVSASAVFRAS